MANIFILFAIFSGLENCYSFYLESLQDLSIQNPDLFGGDILGIEDKQDRNAITNRNLIWPNGVIPYAIDPGLKDTVQNYVLQASFDHYKRHTCIRFIRRTNETDYIRLFPGDGCYSYVGRIGGAQPVSLGQGCGWSGTVIHELGHAIGFYHEQNRSDRDDYLNILWENIMEGMEDQFFKLKPHQNRLLTTFDYDSVMLYGSYSFTKDRKANLKTMTGKNGRFLASVESKSQMSPSDVRRVKMLYNC